MGLRFFEKLTAVLLLVALVSASPNCFAQFGGGGGGFGGGGLGGGGFGGGGFGGGQGGNQAGAAGGSGVVVDADGVLRRNLVNDPNGKLAQQRIAEAMGRLEGDLAKPSKLRKVSLTRLERAVADKLAAGSGPDNTMKHMAGLTRIEYVFCYPETGDIVVAGPAEPWAEAPAGRMLGIDSGRPVIELQDVITALRAFPAQKRDAKQPVLYCSIDPTPEGLSRMHQFLQNYGPRAAVSHDVQFIVEKLQSSLGRQVITIGGIPATTHFAQVMVEADYRMKLIGIGLEQPPVRLKSYVARANAAAMQRNALERWYFSPDYQCVKTAEDRLSMQMIGDGVKLIGESELVTQNGGRQVSGSVNKASQAYTKAFTKTYPKLAQRSPVYAQLRNCIDLAVVAAYIQQNDFYGQVGWAMSVFGSEKQYPVETYNAPEKVASAVNAIMKGRTLVTPIGGGVQIRPLDALNSDNLIKDEDNTIGKAREEIDLKNLADDKWWWD